MPATEGSDSAPSVDSLRKKEDALIERAAAVKEQWKLLITGFKFPPPEPERATTHWDYVLQEANWLAEDVMQERLWKQAAAVRLASAAAAFPRSSLKRMDTVVKCGVSDVLGRVQLAPAGPSSAGQGVSAGDAAAGASSTPADVSDTLAPSTPRRDWEDSPLFYACEPYDSSDALARQLDEADVHRLAQQATALSNYQDWYEIARASRGRAAGAVAHLEPGAMLDDDPLTRKTAPRRKSLKPSPLLGDDEFSDPGMGGGRQSMIPRRPPTGSAYGRPSVLMDDDGALGLDGGREKRKRKTRDFGDEDYIPASKRPGEQPRRAPNGQPARDFDRNNRRNMNGRPGPNTRGGLPPGPSLNNTGLGLRQSLDSMPRVTSGVMRPGMTRSNSGGMERTMGAWSHTDEQVLAAVITEFGHNWLLVADVMRTTSAMQGIFRRPDACKQRYQHLQKTMAEQGEADGADALPSHQPLMTKSMAKELLAASLPVSDSVLKRHQDAVVVLAQRLKSKHLADRQTARDGQRLRADMHMSHVKIQQNVLAAQGGRLLNPLEFGTSAGAGDAHLPLLGGTANAANGVQPSPAPAAAVAADAVAAAAAAAASAVLAGPAGALGEVNPASAINGATGSGGMAGATAQGNGHIGHDIASTSTLPNLSLPAAPLQPGGMLTPAPPLPSTTGLLPQQVPPHDPNALRPPNFPSPGMPAAATASTQQQLLLPGGPALSMQQIGQPMGQQQQQQSTMQAMQQLHNMQFAAGQSPAANGTLQQQQQIQQQQQQLMQGGGNAQILPGQTTSAQQQQQAAAGQMATQQFMAQMQAANRAAAASAASGMLPGMAVSLGAAGTTNREQLAALAAHQKLAMAQRHMELNKQQLQQLQQQQQRGAGPGQSGQLPAAQFQAAAGGTGPNMWGSTPPLGQAGTAAQVGASSTMPAAAMTLQPGTTPNFMQQQQLPTPQPGLPTSSAMLNAQTAMAAMQQQQQQQAQLQQLQQQRSSPSLTAPQQATINARFPGLANAGGGAASGNGSPGPMAQNNPGLISNQLAAAQMARAAQMTPAGLAGMQQALGRMNQLRPAANFPAGLQGMVNGMQGQLLQPGQMANNMQQLMAGGMLGQQAAAGVAAAGLRGDAAAFTAMWPALATQGNLGGQQHASQPSTTGAGGMPGGGGGLPALAGTPTPQQVGSPGMGQQQQQQPLQLAKPPG